MYTDEEYKINLENGLRPTCDKWINDRDDTVIHERSVRLKLKESIATKSRVSRKNMNVSQMHYAKKGIITPEMEFVLY